MKKSIRVSIISRESNTKTLDIKLLEEELLSRGIEVTTLCRLLTKEKSLRSLTYLGHMAKQVIAIMKSKVAIVDTYCIPISMLPHHKNLKVIQMWHAISAVKKFGWQTVGKVDGSSAKIAKLMRMHRGYDYVTAPSDITAGHFAEAFDVPRDKVVKLGLPRIDYIRKVTTDEGKSEKAKEIFSSYPLLRENAKGDSLQETEGQQGRSRRKVVLYAPTFHKGKPVDVRSLVEALDPQKYILVVKLHPIDRATSEVIEAENVLYDSEFPTYDMLSVADIVISDYSSLVVEATLANIPLYIYAYDIESYGETTGLNIDFGREPIASYVFSDASSLASSIEQGYDFDKLRAFRERYIDSDILEGEGSCTKSLADFVESLL